MDQKVSELTESLLVEEGDFLYLVKETSPGVYASRKVKPENFAGQNYANKNLQLTANRSHDMNEFDVLWGKVKTFRAEATVAPTSTYSSFNFRGFGTTSMDKSFRVSSQLGDAFEVFGDRMFRGYGRMSIGSDLVGSDYWLEVFGGNGHAILGRTENGICVAGNDTGNGRGGQFASDSGQAVFASSNTGIAGQFQSTSGYAVDTLGKLRFVGIQIGASGAATNQIYQDTAANILANGDLILAIKQ